MVARPDFPTTWGDPLPHNPTREETPMAAQTSRYDRRMTLLAVAVAFTIGVLIPAAVGTAVWAVVRVVTHFTS